MNESHYTEEKQKTRQALETLILIFFFAFKIGTEVCYSSLLFHCLKQTYHPCKPLFAFYISQRIISRYQLGIKPPNAWKMIILSLCQYTGSLLCICRRLGCISQQAAAVACGKGREPAWHQSHTQCGSNNCDSSVSLVGCTQSGCCILIATAIRDWRQWWGEEKAWLWREAAAVLQECASL